jgi:glycosyltransferase involved in cell wall biosynthesis
VAVIDGLRVLSVYEAFFAGGARALHTNAVIGLNRAGSQRHSVLSIHREMRREATLQRMTEDAGYLALTAAGVPVSCLNRTANAPAVPGAFTASELAIAARQARSADLLLSLKEQPLDLINHPEFPRRPVIVCLHRSDPENQGNALVQLHRAIADGRIVAGICCASSTKAAYQAAGVPAELLQVIPNGVDLKRFRPARPHRRARLRRALGIPSDASAVVFAARYHPMKNVPLLLRAARAFLARDRTGHVLMCGAGMSTGNAELSWDIDTVFAEHPELLPRLRLLGVRRDMPDIYAAADVVSLTSAFGEAAPLCLIEGQLCGAVPVATDVGDCADLVDGRGIITPPDPDAISDAWARACARRTDALPALARCRDRFSHTRMVAAYATLIGRAHRAGRSAVTGRSAAIRSAG